MTTQTQKHRRTEEDRKEQILAAARAVFDEKGYDKATVSDIVRRAGVAQGTFYLYFESKRDAIIDLARQPMEQILTRMDSAMGSATSFEELLRAALRIAFEFERPNMDLCRMMTQASTTRDEMFDGSPTMDRMWEQMVGMFAGAIAGGDMNGSDAEMAAVMFHMTLHGALAEASAKNDQAYSRKVEAAVTEMLVNAFVKRK
ncbi:MAG: TetR/AcrR family transcriptional regulator [Chloroflexi bacterium]|nr:TetR/AcrR family transcriptional regulator [Chloroflexota bacterium]